MGGIATWLLSMARPLLGRVLAALGMGTVTYVGAAAALQSALSAAKTAFGGIGGDVLQLLAMAGFFQAASITTGALVSSLAWVTMKRYAALTVK